MASALLYRRKQLLLPGVWIEILGKADRIVGKEPEAGFTSLLAFCATAHHLAGASSGDSALVVGSANGSPTILTARQLKNPPVGSGAATGVGFTAKLTSPWTVVAMTDGVWKYAGWEAVFKALAERKGQDIMDTLREGARLRQSGAFQDDFTLVVLQTENP
jgi:hypothetical protein